MAAVQCDWGLYKKRGCLHRQAQGEEGVKGRGEKTAVRQPGREAWDGSCPHSPQGTNPAVTWISGFWPPALGDKKFLPFEPPGLWGLPGQRW